MIYMQRQSPNKAGTKWTKNQRSPFTADHFLSNTSCLQLPVQSTCRLMLPLRKKRLCNSTNHYNSFKWLSLYLLETLSDTFVKIILLDCNINVFCMFAVYYNCHFRNGGFLQNYTVKSKLFIWLLCYLDIFEELFIQYFLS